MLKNKELRLAVLIDAENVPYKNIKGMLEEIAKYGMPTIKRIYGDWTRSNISGWKNVLLENAITPIQQYSYTSGKNSSDSAMIIDAMDILYNEIVEGFCIISSDSDFTRLVIRLRESGKKVIGMGERKTPKPFIVACDKFIYIEIIDKISKKDINSSPKEENHPKKSSNLLSHMEREIIDLIYSTIVDVADEDGWAFLADIGNLLQKKRPDFDTRNYGFAKLTQLMKSLDKIEIDERDSGKSNIKHIFVRSVL